MVWAGAGEQASLPANSVPLPKKGKYVLCIIMFSFISPPDEDPGRNLAQKNLLSAWWDFYDSIDNGIAAKCMKCGVVVSRPDGSTVLMKRHVRQPTCYGKVIKLLSFC
jgi:hypothetical protein